MIEQRAKQFSLRRLAILIAYFCFVLSLAKLFGYELGIMFVMVVVFGYVIGKLTHHWGATWSFAITILFTLIPWSGAGVGVMRCPTIDANLPTLNWKIAPFSIVYFFAELPLQFIVTWHPLLDDAIFFRDSADIRPFVVFTFWLAILVGLGLAFVLKSKAI